jgi:hypothetical protein
MLKRFIGENSVSDKEERERRGGREETQTAMRT